MKGSYLFGLGLSAGLIVMSIPLQQENNIYTFSGGIIIAIASSIMGLIEKKQDE